MGPFIALRPSKLLIKSTLRVYGVRRWDFSGGIAGRRRSLRYTRGIELTLFSNRRPEKPLRTKIEFSDRDAPRRLIPIGSCRGCAVHGQLAATAGPSNDAMDASKSDTSPCKGSKAILQSGVIEISRVSSDPSAFRRASNSVVMPLIIIPSLHQESVPFSVGENLDESISRRILGGAMLDLDASYTTPCLSQ